jgi:DNA-binding transcriptional ArsR family regulator
MSNTEQPTCRPEEHPSRPGKKSEFSSLAIARAAQLFRAMGDPARLRILILLLDRQWCVTELVEEMGEKFSTVSQRLRVLRTEGLVGRRRVGTHLYYTLADDHVADLVRNALAHATELELPGRVGGGTELEEVDSP